MKFVSPGNTGVPDRIVLMPSGHIYFVEFKQKGKKPTVIQNRMIERLRNLGATVEVVDEI